MRILVGNNAFANPGGSETYTFAIVEELVKRGHNVECIGKRTGMVSKKLNDLGILVYTSPVKREYDLALLSHSTSIHLARNIKAFKIQTCHGVYPVLEQPVPGMHAYVSISEEVQKHLKIKGFKSILIRNGVNCNRFKPVKKINRNLKTILSLSHSEDVNRMIRTVSWKIGSKFIIHNKYNTPIWDVEKVINEADLVVTLGRGAYEAMSCGRNILIFDKRTYASNKSIGDGIVNGVNISAYMRNNCSGRYSNREFNETDLIVELSMYNRSKGKELRKFALENFNIEKQVDKYLNLIK